MAKLTFEYGKKYEIPVCVESEKITKRLVQGIIHVKKNTSYLTVFVCNEDDLLPFNEDEEVQVDLIWCYQREGGKHLLLVDCKFSSQPMVVTDRLTHYRIYFNYIFNGCEHIESKKDLNFKIIEFLFENVGRWLRPNNSTELKGGKCLFSCDISKLDAKMEFVTSYTDESSDQKNRGSRKINHDVHVVLTKRHGKFSLKQLHDLTIELEALFSCFTAIGCFCIRTDLINVRRQPSPHQVRYNVLDSLHFSEPSYSLKHSFYSLIPCPIDSEVNLSILVNNFFKTKISVRSLMRKIASIFLYKNKFLYDIQFLYIATLLETAYTAFLSTNEEGMQGKVVSFQNQLRTISPPLTDEQINNISDVTARYRKSDPDITYKDKINELLKYQYDDCRLIELSSREQQYVLRNRNKMSHGSSLKIKNDISHHDVLNKLLLLLLYSVFKHLGLESSTLRQRLVASSSHYLHSVNKVALHFTNAKKITIPNNEFLQIKDSEIDLTRIYCTVVEKYNNRHYVNLSYTEYFSRDQYNIKFVSQITDILKSYYLPVDFKKVNYVSSTYIVDEKTSEYILPISLAVVELKKPIAKVRRIMDDSLIPKRAVEYSKINRIPVLKAFRIVSEKTIKGLAERSGLSKSTIAHYGNTFQPPRRETYQRILKCLGTDVSRIFESK